MTAAAKRMREAASARLVVAARRGAEGAWVTTLGLLLGAAAAVAQPAAPAYEVRRAGGEIRVDGVLDEPAWADAVLVVSHLETYPGENLESPARTECRLAYDDRYLYVGLRALDPEPEAIRARYTDRDAAFDDDFAGVVLDTFNDQRRGYEFFVNPLGVQMDLVIDDVAGNEDSSWDAIWASAGRLTPDGYAVEMAIPFAQLRFPAGGGRQTWGIDVVRVWPRDQRRILRSQPQDRDRDCYLCQLSRVAGFEGARPGHSLEVDPTVTAVRAEQREPFPAGSLAGTGTDTDAGVTVRWGVTPSVTLAGAINPDFSQVEADAAQLEVNTQFALFYAEKRPFFLEGADFFDTPIEAVYTRTVADPSWGVKASGKVGREAFGVFVARDDVTNLLLPGKEESELTSLGEENLTGVARLRHDLGAGSTIGALVTARQGDGYSNALLGVDGLLRLSKTDTVTFQALRSTTEYPVALAQEHGQPEGELGGTALLLFYSHDSRDWFWNLEAMTFDEGFRADSGFVPQVDYRVVRTGLQRTWWGEKDAWYTRIKLGGDWDYTEDTEGRLLENEVEAFGMVAGPLQSTLELGLVHRTRAYRGASFAQDLAALWASVRPSAVVWLGIGVSYGDELDFANVRNGTELETELEATVRAGRHLYLSAEHDMQRLDVEGGRLFTARLTQVRAVWQFNLRTFVRLITQYTDITRDPSLYLDPVDSGSEHWFNQALFSYKLNPQTVLFLGYSDTYEGYDRELQRIDLTAASRTVFVKLGYAWLP